jgi:aspartyl-tRNA(Asn)/glutamyl-tRNA(Gln) amidotransferase subunit A
MRLQRRQFLQMAANAVALPAISRAAAAQTTPRPSRERLEQALSRIADPKGEGARACLTVYSDASQAAADSADARARVGVTLGPLDGTIINVKDLFDVSGEPTRAGSKLLAEEHCPRQLMRRWFGACVPLAQLSQRRIT